MSPLLHVLALALLSTTPAHAAAPAECWALHKHGRAAEAQSCFQALTRSREAYVRAEGFWGLEQWDQANEQFRLATGPGDSPALYKVRWGMLLHQRFNNSEAAALFHEALAKDPANAEAYLGLATLSAVGFDNRAAEYAGKAAELDRESAAPHELLATLALENDDTGTAVAEADKALALQPDALDGMAIHAAVELIADRSPDPWLVKLRAINPTPGEQDALIARQLEFHYRYEDAITYFRKAVDAEPRLWSAHSALGIELMRLGQTDEPVHELQLSYDNGYRDAATANSLKLLDSLKHFSTVRDDTTILKLNQAEAPLLQPYLQPELHTILATYEKKYGMKLPGPVQVEVYPDHEDFAVRTLGMPGLGALGVTFGQVVAMDSPSARKPGDFNWGATLWHEMSHVFILTATNHRVPRWFTEGLAVHEEGERSPEWSNRVTPEVLIAIRDKKLLPIARLDRGFVYPEYPSQVVVSYFQAGSICDFIKSKWSEAKLLEIVHSYAAARTTPQVLQADLALTPEAFDTQYLAWLNGRYAAEAAHFDEWRTQLKALATAAQAKHYDAVLAQGPSVVALYPEYVGEANAYEFLAEAHHASNDRSAELADLRAYEQHGGEDPAVLKRLASLEQAAGQGTEAAATLARINYIYPVKDEAFHHQLGDLFYAQKQYDPAIREYTAALASNPVDKAGAEFNLAQAYFAAGQSDKAEERVLAALEVAPGYRPAQKLLLELNQTPSKKQ